MAAPQDCPHDNPVITTRGPYYRQVHPNDFQNGVALPLSFNLKGTGPGCHFAFSLNDAVRTTPERCYREYTEAGLKSAATLEVNYDELTQSGVSLLVDSPYASTFAHLDALYSTPMKKKRLSDIRKELATAATRRGPAYLPPSAI